MKPNRRETMGLLAGAAPAALGMLAALGAPRLARGQATNPNIAFNLLAHLRNSLPSAYTGGILDSPTPRIDRLAAEGLQLTNFNVENQCSPSRAALMTGRLPIRSGIGKAIAAGAPGGLHPWEITIAEMLSGAGYRTAMFGKWHLEAGEGRLPTDQGFDEWFGFETTDIIYWAGKPGMPLRDVHHIREAGKGEKARNVQVYDEDTRRRDDNTLVVWASDNGPSPLPTVTPSWTIGDSGPWRGEIGTVLEGNIRTPCIIRWPGRIPGRRVSNQIVAMVDFIPTLARIAGGKVPADRPIDGVDQLDFFTGRQDKSNREHVLLFLGH